MSAPSAITEAKPQTAQVEFYMAAAIAPDEDFPRREMEAAIDALEERFLALKDTAMPQALAVYNREAAAAKDLFGPIY